MPAGWRKQSGTFKKHTEWRHNNSYDSRADGADIRIFVGSQFGAQVVHHSEYRADAVVYQAKHFWRGNHG